MEYRQSAKKKMERLKENIAQTKRFLSTMQYKPSYLIVPVLLSFTAALFDGLSLGFLVPALNGLLQKDFSIVWNSRVFKMLYSAAPQIFPQDNGTIFAMLVLIIFSAVILKNLFSYFSAVVMCRQMRQFSHSMRSAIFERYLNFGKLFFDRTGVGHLNAVLLYFTEDLAAKLYVFRNTLQNIFTLLICAGLMVGISWRLTIFVAIFYPAFSYPIGWVIKKIRTGSHNYSKAKIILSQKITDILACVPLVKVYANEEKEKKTFQGISRQVANVEFSMDKKTQLIYPLYEIGITIMILLGVSFVAYLYIKENAGSLPRFMVYFVLLKKCLPLISGFAQAQAELARVRGPIKNILEILDDKDKFYILAGTNEFKGLKETIEYKKLNFSYIKDYQVLKNVSFSVEKGKVTALVGSTGSGKTTLVNLLLRFYDCPPGTIFIDGRDIKEFTLESLMRHIALVSQEAFLFNDTIKNNISYGLDRVISYDEIIEVAKKARLYDFVMDLPERFETVIGDRGVKLSGGEKQRLAIARAIIKGCDILIMDEATSSLDATTERLIQEAIDASIKNKTAIVIAHRLSTIKNADKIVVVEKGNIVEQGTLQELLNKRGVFYKYWEEQKFD